MTLDDWRRKNVSDFIHTISTTIKASKPWVQFGISPFGVWRNKSVDPKGSDTQTTSTNYDDLYADPVLWMNQNWIDYIAPQLYWSMDNPKASYSKLVQWWAENSNNTPIYIGHAAYKIKADADKSWDIPTEIPTQIDFLREFKNINGSAYFSAKSFNGKNYDVARLLEENQYKYPALPAAVPNLKRSITVVPTVNKFAKNSAAYTFSIQSPLDTKVRYMVVYGAKHLSKINTNDASQIIDKIAVHVVNNEITFSIPAQKMKPYKAYAVTFIDYASNESAPTVINLK